MSDETPNESTSNHPISDDGYGAAAVSPVVEVEICFSRVNCSTCGIPFQIPAEFKLAKQAETGSSILCPSGHTVTLAKSAAETVENMLSVAVLLAKLAEARNEVAALRSRPLVEKENLLIDKKELLRRCGILAVRASRTDYGRKLCKFCGKELSSDNTNFRNHLMKQHHAEIELMQSAEFR